MSQPRRKKKLTPKKRALKILYWAAIVVILAITLVPILYLISSSFKKIVDIMNPDKLFIFMPTVQNYIDVFTKYDFVKPLINSLIVSVGATVLACIFGLPCAYSIARFKQRKLSLVVLAVRVIPCITFLVPWYIILSRVHLTGTHVALIGANLLVSLPLIIWICTPYFESVPASIEESAMMDGCSVYGSFLKIMIPLSGPGICTAAILSFIYSWNNFMFALILGSAKTRTLPTAVFNFISYTDVNWGGLMAATVVITLPVIVISIILNQYVVGGLTAGAVKG